MPCGVYRGALLYERLNILLANYRPKWLLYTLIKECYEIYTLTHITGFYSILYYVL